MANDISKERKPVDYNTPYRPTWCPGCGNFGIWGALKGALAELNIDPAKVFGTFDIGCSGNGANFVNMHAFHGLHGRALPVAEGVKIANPSLTVIVMAGDGGALGEGACHFVHACRANHDLTYIIHDNQIYGLTTGQTSPTSLAGMKTKSNPSGGIDQPLNPLALALSTGATFVARAFSGDITYATGIIKQAIMHRGFAVVDLMQPCVTFNRINTYQYFRERVYTLDQAGHDPTDFHAAWERMWEWQQKEKIPLGVFYQIEKPTFCDQLPQLKEGDVVHQKLDTDIREMMKNYQ